MPELERSVAFLLKLGKYFVELKSNPEIKQAFAFLFVEMLTPLAAVCAGLLMDAGRCRCGAVLIHVLVANRAPRPR
jgi:hypothetical protein